MYTADAEAETEWWDTHKQDMSYGGDGKGWDSMAEMKGYKKGKKEKEKRRRDTQKGNEQKEK